MFAGDLPAAGATVVSPDGRELTTSAAGAVEIALPAGNHVLRLRQPPTAPAQTMEGVVVAAGLTTEVIATVSKDGALTLDIMVPRDVSKTGETPPVEVRQDLPTGTLRGVVLGEESGQPVAGAGVYVAGQTVDATTDEAGRFELTLPEGAHTLSVIHTKFSTQTIPDVAVTADQASALEITLTPASIELEDFVVAAPHIPGGVAGVLDTRRDSAAVSDAIGAADIAKMPANDAAQAAQRVVGATVVGGRFVYVRGLGERYSNALLNGAPLPSPEPDRATVPLNLFPSQILASIDISKTFTPDVPGDFAGGSVRIVTKSVPEDFLFGTSLSIGANTRTTFVDYLGQTHVGSLDFLAIDDGSRDLSSAIPDDVKLDNRAPRDLREELATEINTPVGLKERTALPNLSANLAIGDSWELGGGGRLGALASLVYRRSPRLRREDTWVSPSFLGPDPDTGEPLIGEAIDYIGSTKQDAVRWGAFSNVTLQASDDHQVSLLMMHSQLADTNTFYLSGFNLQLNNNIATTHQEYISRGLSNGQLQGKHRLQGLNDADVRWLLSLAQAGRNENDTRDFVAIYSERNEIWSWYDGAENGRHFFSDQSEQAKVAGMDWLQPIVTGEWEWKAKLGTLISLKDREFAARSLRLQEFQRGLEDESQLGCGPTFDPATCPPQILTSDVVGSGLIINENTTGVDTYDAKLNVMAAYLMTEVALGQMWRFVGGVRMEDTLQTISPYDQFTGEPSEAQNARLEQTDFLPAGAIVFSPLEEGAVRLAVSQTLARPQLRELAPFAYQDFFGGGLQSGNPDLRLTRILNADLRFEYFPTPSEVAALSFFAKDFRDPIEPAIKPAGDSFVTSFANANGASLFGVELEVRKDLDFFGAFFENFGIIASLMLASSNIRVDQVEGSVTESGIGYLTNTSRPLVQAAPYVVNVAFDYENGHGTQFRILYNVSGPRVSSVGTEGLPDAYVQPRHIVDLTASQALGEHFKLRLNVRNLLDATYLETAGRKKTSDNVFRRYRDGVSASIGLAYDH